MRGRVSVVLEMEYLRGIFPVIAEQIDPKM